MHESSHEMLTYIEVATVKAGHDYFHSHHTNSPSTFEAFALEYVHWHYNTKSVSHSTIGNKLLQKESSKYCFLVEGQCGTGTIRQFQRVLLVNLRFTTSSVVVVCMTRLYCCGTELATVGDELDVQRSIDDLS